MRLTSSSIKTFNWRSLLGVLVAKRFVFKNPVPHGQGGGTVSMVTSEKHSYLEVS